MSQMTIRNRGKTWKTEESIKLSLLLSIEDGEWKRVRKGNKKDTG